MIQCQRTGTGDLRDVLGWWTNPHGACQEFILYMITSILRVAPPFISAMDWAKSIVSIVSASVRHVGGVSTDQLEFGFILF